MEEELMEFLTGVLGNDVQEVCKLLSRIAKAVNPDLTAEAYLEAFGDFWATCFAFPDEPPVTGVQFMVAVFMPDLEFFNRLHGTLHIELTSPAEPGVMTYNLRASPDAQIVSMILRAEVLNRDTDEFRELTLEELDSTAFRGEQIKLRSLSGDVVSHDAPNGAFFTVRDLLHAIEETERQTRDRFRWLGGIDVDHCYFEGIHPAADGVWAIAWGS